MSDEINSENEKELFDDLQDASPLAGDEVVDGYQKGYKLYNFRRPDKFSKEHLRGLQDIHKEFARQLSLALTNYLRMHIEIDVVSVDQLTYDEFIRSMPSQITIGLFELSPLSGQIIMGLSFEVLSSIVDRMLGGVGMSENVQRELTDVEEALATKIIERTIKTLATAWSHVLPVSAVLVGTESNYETIQVATGGEIVALITFEVQVANTHFGLMSLCFTYPTLENVLSQITQQHIFQTKGLMSSAEEKQKMIQKLNTSTVDINVLFGSTEITLKEFLALKEGDVIKLDNKITDNMIVKVNGEKKFFAKPGMVKNKISVKIDDLYDEQIDLLKAYL